MRAERSRRVVIVDQAAESGPAGRQDGGCGRQRRVLVQGESRMPSTLDVTITLAGNKAF